MGNNEHTIVYLIGMGPGNSDCLTGSGTGIIAGDRMYRCFPHACDLEEPL